MTISTSYSLRTASRIATWCGYVTGMFQRSEIRMPIANPFPTPRRQVLLMAQDLKRRGERIRMLELLQAIKNSDGGASRQQR